MTPALIYTRLLNLANTKGMSSISENLVEQFITSGNLSDESVRAGVIYVTSGTLPTTIKSLPVFIIATAFKLNNTDRLNDVQKGVVLQAVLDKFTPTESEIISIIRHVFPVIPQIAVIIASMKYPAPPIEHIYAGLVLPAMALENISIHKYFAREIPADKRLVILEALVHSKLNSAVFELFLSYFFEHDRLEYLHNLFSKITTTKCPRLLQTIIRTLSSNIASVIAKDEITLNHLIRATDAVSIEDGIVVDEHLFSAVTSILNSMDNTSIWHTILLKDRCITNTSKLLFLETVKPQDATLHKAMASLQML